MLAIERKNEILSVLQTEKRVIVAELSKKYNVTEETIRRDLEKLERDGLIRKTYGGAVINDSLNTDLPFRVRKQANIEAKQKIAELVESMVEDGDSIMLDASSSAVYVAKRLKQKKRLTVITNSVEILMELADIRDWRVFSTGGMIKEGSLSLIGLQGERMLESFHVDKAILSCKGIDLSHGITDSNEADCQMKRKMLSAASKVILAVDQTKWNSVAFTKICDLQEVDFVVTEREPASEWKALFEEMNISVVWRDL